MRKLLVVVFCLMLLSTTAFAAETLVGKAQGFGGVLTVQVTKEGNTITSVEVIEHNETPRIAGPAIEQVTQAIVKANSTKVDTVTNATVTSKAIIYAVNNALDPKNYPAPADKKEAAEPKAQTAAEVYLGLGVSSMHRAGPGKDNTDTNVYSFNQVFANVLFDEAGRITSIFVDQLEIVTPNYDGAGSPHFSGFPGQGGYNYDENHDGIIDGKTEDTEANFASEIAGWLTKRARGSSYQMGTGSWAEQMDKFQELFTGMTVAEVEEWFTLYTSDRNGRPLKAGSKNEADAAKYDALNADEKAMLADVVTGATMSLNDSHGDIIAAIRNAYENRVGLDINAAAAQGFGLTNLHRIGPGKDNTGTPVYSINQVFVHTLFDENNRIAAIFVDQLEIATPNYDGEGMPHFSGFPGQGGYNYDENHDGVVDGTTEDTVENFKAEVAGWATKRARGEAYRMGVGSWASQMDRFQELFVGKTVEEVEAWFARYTSDRNGRPLKAGSSNEADAAKYNALNADEQAMLADVVTGATMSLNDSHGDIVAAIRKSFENRIKIDLTVK